MHCCVLHGVCLGDACEIADHIVDHVAQIGLGGMACFAGFYGAGGGGVGATADAKILTAFCRPLPLLSYYLVPLYANGSTVRSRNLCHFRMWQAGVFLPSPPS